jgi:hypothetical protein
MQWHCTLAIHPPMAFEEKHQFEEHMLQEHRGKLNPSQLSMLVRIGARPMIRPFNECPLCKIRPEDISALDGLSRDNDFPDLLPRHVAGNMKSLALMFLPPRDDIADDETNSERSFSSKKSSQSVESNDSIFNISLTFDDDAASDKVSESNNDWSFLSTNPYVGHETDPTLQGFIKRHRPPQTYEATREDWKTFFKVTEDQIEIRSWKEIKRQYILHEIVMSEDNYMDRLNILRVLYRNEIESWQPPIIRPDTLSRFISDVFGKLDAVQLANRNHLIGQLHYRQREQGPWITGFSDIFRHWIEAARQPYMEYAAEFPHARYIMHREAHRNPVFHQFLDQARDNRLSERLD